jgi:hypothetical protein
MSIVRNTVRDLVERRLWPVAALLVLGLLAVPVLLTKGEPPAPAPAADAMLSDDGALVSVVAPAPRSSLKDDERRLVGRRKDVFASPAAPVASTAGAGSVATAPEPTSSAPAPAPDTSSSGGSGASGGGPPAGGSGESPPRSTTPSAPAPRPRTTLTYHAVDLRFGRAGSTPKAQTNIARLTPMPSAKRPGVLFFGVFNGGSSAGFLVANGVRATGSNCTGRTATCSLLRLGAGRKATIGIPDASGRTLNYTLEVLRIRTVRSTSAAAAREALSRESRAGRCIVSAEGNPFGTVLFDPKSNTYSSVTPGEGECKDVLAPEAGEGGVSFRGFRGVVPGP